MRKIIFSVMVLAGTTLGMSSTANAQAVEQGNVIIDAYYGFPNLYTAVFKSAYANSGTEENIKISGIGPVGIRGEYMVADKIGIGLDLGMNNTKLTFEDESFVNYDSNGNPVYATYEYTYTTQKIGALVTFNYHFLENDKVDAYAVIGAGYGNRTFKFESTDPNYTEESISGLVPVASKIGVGMRYFFTDNIGANIALGFGQGGIINAGISAKF